MTLGAGIGKGIKSQWLIPVRMATDTLIAGMLLPVAVWERGIRFPRQSCHGSSVEPNNMSISLIHTYHEGGLG